MNRPGVDLRSVAGLAVLATALAVTVAGLVGSPLGSDDADAETVVRSVTGIATVLDDGAPRTLRAGDVVPRGGAVSTLAGSGVVLDTDGRLVEVGPSSALTVEDGSRQDLQSGLVLVDTRRGPALALEAAAAEVRSDGGVLRVVSTEALRVASYRGAAEVQATGRRAVERVPALYETTVAPGGLPGQVTALRLTPLDSWERRPDVAGGLVWSNTLLDRLATGLDSDYGLGPAAVKAVPQEVRAFAGEPTDPRPSEIALGYAVARAAEVGASEPDSYSTVRASRDSGGSWGVVAAIVAAEAQRASAALEELLASPATPTTPGAPAPAASVGDVIEDVIGDVLNGPGSPSAPSAPAVPTRPATPAPPPRPTRPVAPTTPPTAPTVPVVPPLPLPSPVPNLIDGVLGTVGGVVGGLLNPGAAPQATTPPARTVPAPAATTDPGLISSLLDLLDG